MNEPTAKKLIESAPEHILNMTPSEALDGLELMYSDVVASISLLQKHKIAIDWAGELCVCYPFQNVHTPTLGEQATLLSISDRNPRIAIVKAVIWQQEVLAKSN